MNLKKSIYDLRHSPKNWFGTMGDHHSNIGFHLLKSDPCVYTFEAKAVFSILTIHVNGILSHGNDKQLLGKQKMQLTDPFEMTDLADMLGAFGINVTRDHKNGTIIIYQQDYTEDILERYGMTSCRPTFTPGVGSELFVNQPKDRRGKKAAVSLYHRRTDVPRASLTVRHPLRGQPAGEGNVQALEGPHEGGQVCTPVLGRVCGAHNHLQHGSFKLATFIIKFSHKLMSKIQPVVTTLKNTIRKGKRTTYSPYTRGNCNGTKYSEKRHLQRNKNKKQKQKETETKKQRTQTVVRLHRRQLGSGPRQRQVDLDGHRGACLSALKLDSRASLLNRPWKLSP